VHARSPETFAVPLLLLHGHSGSVAEFQDIVPALADPRAGAETASRFMSSARRCPDSVCRALHPRRLAAEACAALMAQLGYTPLLGGRQRLGRQHRARACSPRAAPRRRSVGDVGRGYPSEDPLELAALSSQEKSH